MTDREFSDYEQGSLSAYGQPYEGEGYIEAIAETDITVTEDYYSDSDAAAQPMPDEKKHGQLDKADIMNLCRFEDSKTLGGLVVNANERAPASGWQEDAGDYGMHVPHGSRNCILLHADYIKGREQAEHDLMQAGTYVALHQELRSRLFVVGITFEPLARLAVKGAGFSYLTPHHLRLDFMARIVDAYEMTSLARRRPLSIAMVGMRTEDFVDRFADKRLGGDAQALLNVMSGQNDIY